MGKSKYIHADEYDTDDEVREVNVDELESAFNQFVDGEYPSHEIVMYADYRDELDYSTIVEILDSNYPMDVFYDLINDSYFDADNEYLDMIEDEFTSWCERNGYPFTGDDLVDNDVYIQDYISIVPDYDHYLSQTVYCRLLVDNGDANYDFSTNPSQDNSYEIGDGAGIIWLGEQFGYSVDQMQEALSSDTMPEDKFLKSLVEEAVNGWGLLALTFICKMELADLLEFKEKKCDVIVDLNGVNCGFYDGWNGGGSLFGIDCPTKSITIPYDKIYELVPDYGSYSVGGVYGMSKSAYDDARLAE